MACVHCLPFNNQTMFFLILCLTNVINVAVTQNCPDLRDIPNSQSVVYSATPHINNSMANVNCSTDPYTFIPRPFSVKCKAGVWTSTPVCLDPRDRLKPAVVTNCRSGCEWDQEAVSALFMPSFCTTGKLMAGDFDGDSYCDRVCYNLNKTVQVMQFDYSTRSHVEPLGTSGGQGLFPSTFCETGTDVIGGDVNRDGISDLICKMSENGNFTDALVLWGKSGNGLESLTAPSRMYLDKNEYECTGIYVKRLIHRGVITCSNPSMMKFGRFCFIGTGNTTFTRDENPCSALGMTYPYIEDANDLHWLNRARQYFGTERTWLLARRQNGGPFESNESSVNYLPWKSGHPILNLDCATLEGYTETEIISVDCFSKHKQLCQEPTADTSMCNDLVVPNATVSYSQWSRPEQSTAKVTCDTQFELSPKSGDGIVTCLYTFAWNRKVTCNYKPCKLFVVENGSFNINAATSTATTICDDGFQLRGHQAPIVCSASGMLIYPLPPICARVQSKSAFLITTGETLAKLGSNVKVSEFRVTTVTQCTLKCSDDLQCLTASYDANSLICELFDLNPRSMFKIPAPQNVKLIVFDQ